MVIFLIILGVRNTFFPPSKFKTSKMNYQRFLVSFFCLLLCILEIILVRCPCLMSSLFLKIFTRITESFMHMQKFFSFSKSDFACFLNSVFILRYGSIELSCLNRLVLCVFALSNISGFSSTTLPLLCLEGLA